jgi:signal transduction histidine kinase
MSTLSIPPLVTASIVFAFGAFAFYLFARRRRRDDLSFALTCLCVVGYDVATAGLYSSSTPAEASEWQRVQVLGLTFCAIALIEFISDYTGQVDRSWKRVFVAYFLVAGLTVAAERSGLTWRVDQPSVKHIELPWGWSVTYQEAAAGPLAHFHSVMGILWFLWAFSATLRAHRAGQLERARALALALGFFFLTMLNDMCVMAGWYRSVYLLEYGYLGMVVLMVLAISGELVQAGAVKAEREVLEEQLRQAARMEAIGRLAGGVAHDLNNQLTPILGYADAALEKRQLEVDLWTYFEQIRDAAGHARELTQQLLVFSRRQVLNLSTLNLNQVVQGAQIMLERLLPREISFQVKLDPRLGSVRADPTQLRRILFNLVLNAREAMPQGGLLEISTRRLTRSESDHAAAGLNSGDYTVLVVRDTGVGMDPTTQARVFEPFFTTKEPLRNTGLGLATVYGIVQQHSGQIRVESMRGHGSVFEVWLPEVAQPGAPSRGLGT